MKNIQEYLYIIAPIFIGLALHLIIRAFIAHRLMESKKNHLIYQFIYWFALMFIGGAIFSLLRKGGFIT